MKKKAVTLALKTTIMKKVMMTMMAALFAIAANAQYNVGTSSKYTDSFGNSTSTHKKQYGQTIGSSSSYTDSFGNTTTNQKSNNENTTIWSW